MAQTVRNGNWTPKSQKNPARFARRLTFFDPFEYRSPHNMSPCSRTTRFPVLRTPKSGHVPGEAAPHFPMFATPMIKSFNIIQFLLKIEGGG
ncbi:MAG: hypothetical protein ACYCXP_02235 [Leptospirillum sp.]